VCYLSCHLFAIANRRFSQLASSSDPAAAPYSVVPPWALNLPFLGWLWFRGSWRFGWRRHRWLFGSGLVGSGLVGSGLVVGVCRFCVSSLSEGFADASQKSVPASCHCDRCFCHSAHAVRSTYTSVRLERLLHLPLRSCAGAVYCCVRKQNAVHAANLSAHVLYYHVWCVPDVPGMCTLHTGGTEPFFFADDAYLDYLSMQYAIRVRFLPSDHILADQPEYIRGTPKPVYPSRHRLDSLIAHLTVGVLEDRFRHIEASIPRVQSPHLDKHTNPVGIHERWIQSLPDFTMLLYTDGSKLEDGRTGSGWVTYCVGNGIARRISAGHCHLGTRAEVFDAELHAAQEALVVLQHLDTPVATAYLCVDNQSALDTLHGNASQTQYSRTAAAIATELVQHGWKILGIWTPAHVGIVGNEAADSEAKAGAATSSPTACAHARTTKTWMLTQSRQRLRERWHAALPDAVPSSRFPDHLRSLRWPDTRALWRLYAGRTPSDRDPGADHDKDPEPCDCGESYVSSAHILLECRLFSRTRSRMLQKAPDVTISSVLQPAHALPVLEFLKTTRLGYAADLRAEDEERRGGGSDGDGGGRGSDGGSGGSGGSEMGREAGCEGMEREEVESEGEWRFGLFE
jgi:ribonuclease HI